MSDVDSVSNSGLYPALPISDRQGSRERSAGEPPPEKPATKPSVKHEPGPPLDAPRNPKSIIDEYA
jgi:hypothetical protein